VSRPPVDWFAVLERLAGGDELAYVEVSRLVVGVLRRLRAYDFEDDWSDVVQEVAVALVGAFREGRLDETDAVGGYARQIARNKFSDRLRQRERRSEPETFEIEAEGLEGEEPLQVTRDEPLSLDLNEALRQLPKPQRDLVVAIYGLRMTYEEAARELGIPLGTAKRQLAIGLRRLRSRLRER
jgi:RNA polymerase sigma factor (sigma-70 family)